MADAGPPTFVRMAAHPVRWQLLRALAESDLRVRELVARVGEPQNAVSYHLRLLRDAGLVRATRSTFDGRDSYYHLDLRRCAQALAECGPALHPALRPGPDGAPAPGVTVLFVCTGNSARSPIAEALLRRHTGGRAAVTSAGTRPRPELHPRTVRVLREQFGIDVADRRPQPLDRVADRAFDCVVTLCDKAREAVPDFGARTRRVHWSIPEPPDEAAAFRRTAAEIDVRVRHLVPVLATTDREEVQP
ncbi:MAG TPA: metalloregulator ArsR/SmtB family transcription factor [Pseudonocardia sp.]|mgnify:CR=1 FL=1|jgi:protein-tyrosine-phosphatase/DNA-binding transcriptional ArsR family regulator|uniref:metalloregulator ArsR/SmtB family transcription factor n=1 Tax=Pseudonocardia sp. TaxID=60912 RepID=UPI002B4B02F9|nr:metalloregulator ArsR/SmtB family transcription factor [Pseudonocardia sp.]HLU59403.1 metalloregulator ArsR/SmtB family transcription factor [Pseudonocardia sp.]